MSIKTSLTSRSVNIYIRLDMNRISGAELGINAHTVKESILRTPRIKLTSQVQFT